MSTNPQYLQKQRDALRQQIEGYMSALRHHSKNDNTLKESVDNRLGPLKKLKDLAGVAKDSAALKDLKEQLEQQYTKYPLRWAKTEVQAIRANLVAADAALGQTKPAESKAEPAVTKTTPMDTKDLDELEAILEQAEETSDLEEFTLDDEAIAGIDRAWDSRVQDAANVRMSNAVSKLAQASLGAGFTAESIKLNSLATQIEKGQLTPAKVEEKLKSALLDSMKDDDEFPAKARQSDIDRYQKAARELGDIVYPKGSAKEWNPTQPQASAKQTTEGPVIGRHRSGAGQKVWEQTTNAAKSAGPLTSVENKSSMVSKAVDKNRGIHGSEKIPTSQATKTVGASAEPPATRPRR